MAPQLSEPTIRAGLPVSRNQGYKTGHEQGHAKGFIFGLLIGLIVMGSVWLSFTLMP